MPDGLSTVPMPICSSSQTESGKEALLRLSSKLVVLCQRTTTPQLMKIASTLHTYLLTLGRYDPSWTIRALTRMYAGLGGIIKVPSNEDPSTETAQLEQDAFANGEAIAIPVSPAATEDHDSQKLASEIRTVILGNTSQYRAQQDGKSSTQLERLAGWQKLPDWPEQAPQHNLRNSTVEAAASSAKAYRGFGNSPSSSTPVSRSTSHQGISRQKQLGRRKAEKVVLVPTEHNSSAPQKTRPVDLQAFLESLEGEEDKEETETETESETESETDSDDDAVVAEMKEVGPMPGVEDDSEASTSTSEDEDSSDEGDAQAPLVR